MALARTVVSLEKKLEKVTMKVKQADWHTYICKKAYHHVITANFFKKNHSLTKKLKIETRFRNCYDQETVKRSFFQ